MSSYGLIIGVGGLIGTDLADRRRDVGCQAVGFENSIGEQLVMLSSVNLPTSARGQLIDSFRALM